MAYSCVPVGQRKMVQKPKHKGLRHCSSKKVGCDDPFFLVVAVVSLLFVVCRRMLQRSLRLTKYDHSMKILVPGVFVQCF